MAWRRISSFLSGALGSDADITYATANLNLKAPPYGVNSTRTSSSVCRAQQSQASCTCPASRPIGTTCVLLRGAL